MNKYFLFQISVLVLIIFSCTPQNSTNSEKKNDLVSFSISAESEQFLIFKHGFKNPIIIQNVQKDFRPYLHPLTAPNSEVSLTEFSPSHHKHQTGLYWGFTRVNGLGIEKDSLDKWFYVKDKPKNISDGIGRDYFHNPGSDFWQKVGAEVIIGEGPEVKWKTSYNMLDANGKSILLETQTWTLTEKENMYFLKLEWKGEALEDFTVNEFDYGGLFLRMPWKEGVSGEVSNAARQKNNNAEGQRAMWVDAGMEIKGLDKPGHIAIFDHPDNDGFPQSWRVDNQLGIGPVSAREGDWSIKKGEVKSFQHQVVAYSGDRNDIILNDLWGDYAGDKGMYNTASLWGIAQKEAREAKFLSPEEAVKAMTIKEGYKVNIFAAEPMITQPMAFCWDDKGRLWIAENRDYESRQRGFSNFGDSKILILEDSDHDGVVDTKKVFLENIPFPSAIAVGHGGLFLGAPPNLLFVPDSDGDDKADFENIKVLLTGWGIRDRHETINSFHWGPDGWLYGLEGFATPSKIRKPLGKGKIYKHRESFPDDLLEGEGVDINGGVWRYHPLKERFEVVAHGFSNPWGIDYDEKGQLFISACVIPHLFHIIPGGIYQRQGGSHFNPYVYEDIQTIVDHRHRSAHGGARIYQSDAFSSDQQGRIFMANIHEHAVLSDVLTKNGSGFNASHGEDFLLANNAQWIGFSLEVGPDGGIYVLDWHDADICGMEVANKETGRVFRIMPENSKAENWEGRYKDLALFSDEELVNLQSSKSNWHAQRARIILQHRASTKALSESSIFELKRLLIKEKNGSIRLRALWTLFTTNNISTLDLVNLLKDKDEYIRAWAIQFLCEDGLSDNATLDALNQLSKNEKSAVVRLYLASALQKINKDERWNIAQELSKYDKDANDPNIPFMLWFAIEPLIMENHKKALNLAKTSKIPSISNKIARRIVDGGSLNILVDAFKDESKGRKDMIEGLLAGLQNHSDLTEPSNWESVKKVIKLDRNLSQLIEDVDQQFGNSESALKMMESLKNINTKSDVKQKAIINLAAQQRKELEKLIPELIKQPELRIEAIRAIAAYDNEELGKLLLINYSNLNAAEKQEALQTLSSRSVYGWQLAKAIENKSIPKSEIPAYIAMQIRRVVGNGFVEIWGPIDNVTSNIETQLKKYQRLLTEERLYKADYEHGQVVYQKTCSPCHKLFGNGGQLGPELTGSNRTNISYLLSNILNPNGEIQEDYKMVIVSTNDGRIYSGNIIAENSQNITLRTVGQDAISINKSKIQDREVSDKSMMPEGLLETLSDKEIVDLIGFLKKLEPNKTFKEIN